MQPIYNVSDKFSLETKTEVYFRQNI